MLHCAVYYDAVSYYVARTGGVVARDQLAIYFDPNRNDLEAKLKELAELPDTPYTGRSVSTVGRMLLERVVDEELKRWRPEPAV